MRIGKKGFVDTQTIVGGLISILVIGMVINLGLGINDKVGDSIGDDLTGNALAVKGNSSANIEDSYELGSNLPMVIIAVVLVAVLLAMTRYF